MRRPCGLLGGGALSVVLLAARAEAAPCDGERVDRGTPIQVPLGPAGFGTLPEACSATSLAFKGTGAALVASEDFYGYLTGSASLVGRYALPRGDWLSLQTPSLDYWYSANATVEADTVELGAGAVGYHLALPSAWGIQAAPYLKVLLPTDTVYHHARRYGIAHGVSAAFDLTPSLQLVGGVTFPTLLVENNGTSHTTQIAQAALDGSLQLFSFFSLAAGLGVRVRSGRVSGFESLDPRLALRFFPYRALYVDVSFVAPVLGDDRTDLAGALTVGWRFGGGH